MKKCCFLNILFGVIFGFFLNMFFIYSQYVEATNNMKHDHKICNNCICDV